MTGTVAATLRPYLVRSACPRSISWRYSPHPARWGQCPGRFTSLASGSTPAGISGCAPWERRWQKTPARGTGPEPHSSGRGGNYPSKGTLLPSVVNGWRTGPVPSPGLRLVTSGGQKTGCPNRRCVWRSSQEPNFAADHHRAKLPLFRHASSCPLFDRLTINRLGTEWARIDEGVYDACRDLRDYRPPRW